MSDKNSANNDFNSEDNDNLAQDASLEDAYLKQEAEIEELVGNIEKETDKTRAELDEVKDKYLRLVAEFDNFRRRNAKERIELIQTAGRDTIESLLVVLDDMDRATLQIEQTPHAEKLKEGVSLVFNKLRTILQQKGLRPMDCSNKEFDPDLHDAITEIPAPNEDMKGKIIDVVAPGYYLNDKLIRHAKVVIGK